MQSKSEEITNGKMSQQRKKIVRRASPAALTAVLGKMLFLFFSGRVQIFMCSGIFISLFTSSFLDSVLKAFI